ncbi:hypothetical protein A33M_3577 [Rhodovulum sp. PH10]|nr:hypothetical protein A33M_3577 [Rhodovulum sp. PH10]
MPQAPAPATRRGAGTTVSRNEALLARPGHARVRPSIYCDAKSPVADCRKTNNFEETPAPCSDGGLP